MRQSIKKYFGLLVVGLLLSAQGVFASGADSILRQYLHKEMISLYSAEDVEVYTNGYDKFDALFSDIRQARHHIHVEYFIFANDSISQEFLGLLMQKAAEGVEVRLVIDDFKSVTRDYGYDEKRCETLRHAGIEIHMFDPWKFPYINHIARDHRKIVVIDGEIGYIGGLNVADYYLKGDAAAYGMWRDTHVRIEGPAVEGLQHLFFDAFVMSQGDPFLGSKYYPFSESQDVAGDIEIAYIERSRVSKHKKAETRQAFIQAFNSAQKKIQLVSPYFLPTYTVRKALVDAIERGVEVEILFSLEGDMPLLTHGNMNLAKNLVKRGAKVYLYRGAFHHSKIMMVDGVYSMVGSANLNSRSLKWDYEASCFIFNRNVTDRLTDIFEQDKLSCDTLTLQYYRQLPLKKRLSGAIVNHLFTPFL